MVCVYGSRWVTPFCGYSLQQELISPFELRLKDSLSFLGAFSITYPPRWTQENLFSSKTFKSVTLEPLAIYGKDDSVF